jgi:hypothetical protein
MEKPKHVQALSEVLAILEELDPEQRSRVITTLITFFDHGKAARHLFQDDPSQVVDISRIRQLNATPIPFSESRDTTPKEFILQKKPKSDVERVACLAYYLTHYRNTPHFKNADITTLNTEAAQPRLSNPSMSISNAVRGGYLAQAPQGDRQISGQGEQFVLALPDREAAKASFSSRPPRPRKNKIKQLQARGKAKTQ